jgi:predicted nucleic acid-binding protein
MKRLVIDASVACQLLLPEPLSDRATKLIDGALELYAPEFIHLEVGNALWKRTQRGELDIEDAQLHLASFLRLKIQFTAASDLLISALEIAVGARRTIYDSCYLALARSLKVPCVTADKRLVNALSATEFAPLATWLGDI